jgi:hypothetical protein
MDKYDTMEYSQVKAITVFVRLQNSLCALINTNNAYVQHKYHECIGDDMT